MGINGKKLLGRLPALTLIAFALLQCYLLFTHRQEFVRALRWLSRRLIAENIAPILNAILWPTVAVVFLITFQAELGALIKRIKSGFGVDFDPADPPKSMGTELEASGTTVAQLTASDAVAVTTTSAEAAAPTDPSHARIAAARAESAAIIKAAQLEAQQAIDVARNAAKEFGDQQQAKVIARAADLLAKAQQSIELEHKKMLDEARSEIAAAKKDVVPRQDVVGGPLNKEKLGQIFWLSGDLHSLIWQLVTGGSRDKILFYLRQANHHMIQCGLKGHPYQRQMELLHQKALGKLSHEWTADLRKNYATDVDSLMRQVALLAQSQQGDFVGDEQEAAERAAKG